MQFRTGQLLNNKYEIVKEIGTGGTADVFLAKNLLNHKIVALKISKTDAKVSSVALRFKQEYDSLVKFNNQNIIKVYEYFLVSDRQVIVMEYIQGITLKEELKKYKYISTRKAVEYILQILNALKDLHEKNIFHRDLSSSNIMITNDGNLKLMDFGIVQTSFDQHLTKTGNVIGTISYMAPEIIRQQKANPRSEIYSLGILLYSMLTGSVPFKGELMETAQKHLKEKPIPPYKINFSLDKNISEVILKMLEKDAFERYQSSEEMIEVLNNYLKIDSKTPQKEIDKLLKLEKNIEKKKFSIFGKFKKN